MGLLNNMIVASSVLVITLMIGNSPLPAQDPVLVAAGAIACNAFFDPDHTVCKQAETSNAILGINPDVVLPIGPLQWPDGTYSDFMTYYDRSWGRLLGISYPVPGNVEFHTPNLQGYFDYFNGPGNFTGPAGDRDKGYYSFDIGNWHIMALNSVCPFTSCEPDSLQIAWLQNDLANNQQPCTLAFWSRPRFESDDPGDSPYNFWTTLYGSVADVVLNAGAHNFERYAPQTPMGYQDITRGLREIKVGTGGRSLDAFTGPTAPQNVEARNDQTIGVLKLTLRATSYDWEFRPVSGGSFTDSGSDTCHAFDLCGFSAAVDNSSFPNNGGTGTVSVSASSTCTWAARSTSPWITITSGVDGQGNGTATFAVMANTDPLPRTGSVIVAGNVMIVIQDGTDTSQKFSDVSPANPFFDYISLMYGQGFAEPCGAGQFCPDAGVTRGQFMAYVIRALYGENFSPTLTPYYDDVPPSHPFFKYIQMATDQGIGNPCTLTGFCPDAALTRREAADFIITAKFPLTWDPFNFEQIPFFTDVDPSDNFYGHMQKIYELGISSGCAGSQGLYCPFDPLPRGEAAAVVARGLLNNQGCFWCSFTLPYPVELVEE